MFLWLVIHFFITHNRFGYFNPDGKSTLKWVPMAMGLLLRIQVLAEISIAAIRKNEYDISASTRSD